MKFSLLLIALLFVSLGAGVSQASAALHDNTHQSSCPHEEIEVGELEVLSPTNTGIEFVLSDLDSTISIDYQKNPLSTYQSIDRPPS